MEAESKNCHAKTMLSLEKPIKLNYEKIVVVYYKSKARAKESI